VQSSPIVRADTQVRSYEPNETDFANPERGFSKRWYDSQIDIRALNMSILHHYFRLDDYRNSPLPESFLEKSRTLFAKVRQAGIKIVPRFTYSFPKDGKYIDTDTALPRAMEHLRQLRPLLQENSDVIAFMEAGFIGAWGEWHHSTSGLEELPAKSAILHELLDILPPERAVVLRYQRDKKAIFGRSTPITAEEAFSGRPVARVGHHNDCFLASEDNWATYRLGSGEPSLESQKEYLRAENRYVPQGGETCNVAADAQPYIQCKSALAELQFLRWSQLFRDYHAEVIALWQKQGCYEEIAKRLGYRLRLTEVSLPRTVKQGGIFQAKVTLRNDGFASPYNPRGFEVILRNRASKREYVLELAHDPRRWLGGETQSLELEGGIPNSMESGDYEVILNLPDPAPRLYARPEYSIRLANKQVWEPATGYNLLGITVAVSPSSRGLDYSGSNFFTAKAKAGDPL
jgi:hypothetical protein